MIWVRDFWRRMAKAVRLVRVSRFRSPLLLRGVAAACEHAGVLGGLRVRTVIDAGAHCGQFSLLALELFPEATIHAFEPLAGPFARLESWSVGEPRLIRYPLALGAAAGKAVMEIAARDDSSSLLPITGRQSELFPGTHPVGRETLTVARLDCVFSSPERVERPLLLKIDVQGSELAVIEGAGALLESVDWVYVECSFLELYAGQALAPAITARLESAGFVRVAECNLIHDKKGRPAQADLLFRRNGPGFLPKGEAV